MRRLWSKIDCCAVMKDFCTAFSLKGRFESPSGDYNIFYILFFSACGRNNTEYLV